MSYTNTKKSAAKEELKKESPHVPSTTDHTCEFDLTNNWDVPITGVTVRHTSGEQEDLLEIDRLGVSETSKRQTCHFKTGFGAPHDYWFIRFTADGGAKGGTWACKKNFYCDLREPDAGKLVLTSVTVVETDWYVTEPSGRCYVSLSKEG
jgi:hypothetical protein